MPREDHRHEILPSSPYSSECSIEGSLEHLWDEQNEHSRTILYPTQPALHSERPRTGEEARASNTTTALITSNIETHTPKIERAGTHHKREDSYWHPERLGVDAPAMSPTAGLEKSEYGTEGSWTISTLKSGTRQTSLGEQESEEEELDEANGPHLPAQDLGDLPYNHVFEAFIPPSIVEQACLDATQCSRPLSEEEFQDFQSKPLEARRQALDVYFKELTARTWEQDFV